MVKYDSNKRPVSIENTDAGPQLDEELAERREEAQGMAKNSAKILKHLETTQRVIAIEIDQTGLSEEGWAMVDSLQAFLASERGGIIYAPDDGYFDARLKRIARV